MTDPDPYVWYIYIYGLVTFSINEDPSQILAFVYHAYMDPSWDIAQSYSTTLTEA